MFTQYKVQKSLKVEGYYVVLQECKKMARSEVYKVM